MELEKMGMLLSIKLVDE